MNKGVYLLIVCALAAVAAVGTFSVGKLKNVDSVDLTDPHEGKGKGTDSEPVEVAPVNRMASATTPLQELWEMTLFKPERTEAEETGDPAVLAAEQEVNAEFELAGIARLGLPGQAQPVAIIRSRQKAAPRNLRERGRAAGGRDGGFQRRDREEAKQEETDESAKTVFKRGDSINNTGYMLSAIYPDEKYVELSRGREIIKLYIDYNSEASLARRKTAVAQEEALNKQRSNEHDARARDAADLAARNAAGAAKNAEPQTNNGGIPAEVSNNTARAQDTRPGRNGQSQERRAQTTAPGDNRQQPPMPPGTRNGGGRGSSSGNGSDRINRMNGGRQRVRQ